MKKTAILFHPFLSVLLFAKNKFHYFFAAAIAVMPGLVEGQQVIGSFPEMEGGFENTTTAANTTTAYAAGTQLTAWTGGHGSGGSNPDINTTTVRTGSNSLQWVTSGSNRLLFSRSAANAAIANATSYVVQFYWWKGHTNNIRSFDISAGPAGTLNMSSTVNTGNLGGSAASTSWTKQTVVVTTGTNNTSPRYGLVRLNMGGGSVPTPGYIFDDFCVYPGNSADITAPNNVTSPSATYSSPTQLNLSWTAPAGGLDGGGYVVVRYTTDPVNQSAPNANGIYKTGSTVGTNGTVAYVGTSTSFSDAGLTASTFYYYRVYAVDKAFNFSANPITFGGYTAAAVSPQLTLNIPATPAAAIERNSVTDIIYSFNLTQTAHFTTLTQLSFPNTSGTYATGDFLNFKLYASSTNTFPGGTPLATISSPAAATPHTFTGFSQIIPALGTIYFWITADVSATAVYNNSITVSPALASGNFTFSAATTVNNGTINAAGAQTITPPAVYTWNGSISTNWQTADNWTPSRGTLRTTDELYFPAGTWTSTDVPTQTIAYLSILGNVTLTPAATNTLTVKSTSGLGFPDLVISAGRSLTLNANLTLALSDATTADISGVLNINSNAVYSSDAPNSITTVTNAGYPLAVDGIINNYGNLTSTNAARLVMTNGSVYNHAIDGGIIPRATWNTNSTCLVTGTTGAGGFSSGNNQTFSKFIWDCAGQTNTRFVLTAGASSSFSVTDSLIVRRTNGKILQLTSTSGQKDVTCGNYIQYGGIVAVTFETNEVGGQRSLTVNNTFYVTDSLSTGARFQLINNPNSEVTNGRLFVKGNVVMRMYNTSATLEKVGVTAANAEIWFTGTSAQSARFDQFSGDVDFVNDHTGTGVTLLTNAIANKFDLRRGEFYINGNTLTIRAAVSYNGSGTGLLAGSSTSNLILQGITGTVKFFNGYKILKDLTLTANATASLGTELSITAGALPGCVTLGSLAALTTNDSLILRSDANGTSRIAQVPTSAGVAQATVNGRVQVERYLPMNTTYDSRRWRLVTAPFKNNAAAPTINAGWQEGAVCPDRLNPNPYNPRPGYGTHITVSTTAANGFDQGVRNNPSIFYYKNTTNGWAAPVNTTSVKLTDSTGVYLLFARGDRSIIIVDQFVNAVPTTLAPKGELNLGDVTKAQFGSGFQTIGNPYASAIKLDSVVFNDTLGKRKFIYLWDPKIGGQAGVGGFITCQGDNNPGPPYSYTYAGAPVSSYSSNPGVIESSGAFMTRVNGGNTVFHESDKITTSSTIGVASRPMLVNTQRTGFGKLRKFYTDLFKIKNDEGAVILDGVAMVYNTNYSNSIDDMDAPKINVLNNREQLSIKQSGLLLSIERRTNVSTEDTIQLYIEKLKQGEFRFGFRSEQFDENYKAFLKDKFTGTLTPINLGSNAAYTFSITADAATFAADRFMIIFRKKAIVRDITVKATQYNNDIAVDWKNNGNIFKAPYIVERSADNGRTFTVLTEEKISAGTVLSFTDENPAPGNYQYRIRNTDDDGIIFYSNIATIEKIAVKSLPSVYPNPVRNGQVNLYMGLMPKGIYTVQLLANNGQLMHSQVINHQNSLATKIITVKNKVAKGNYKLEILNANKTVTVINILIQ